MSDTDIRALERMALKDPEALDRLIVALERTGQGPMVGEPVKSFDEYVARRLFEVKKGRAEEDRDFSLARRLLARFVYRYGVTKQSRQGVCVGRLLKGRCTAGSLSSRCLCETLRKHWNNDHGDMWLKDGKVIAVTSQPYAHYQEVKIAANVFACYGIKLVDLGVEASWYYPGRTTLLVATALEERVVPDVKIIEITRTPEDLRPLAITLSFGGKDLPLSRLSGRTLLSWTAVQRLVFSRHLVMLPKLSRQEWNRLLQEAMPKHIVVTSDH